MSGKSSSGRVASPWRERAADLRSTFGAVVGCFQDRPSADARRGVAKLHSMTWTRPGVRQRWKLLASFLLSAGLIAASPPSASAISEADRLWLVGERAFQDGLFELSRRSFQRLIDRFPTDARVSEATLLLGKASLASGDAQAALEAFRKSQGFAPPPGKTEEARFWEAEALLRMKRFTEARAVFERVVADPGSPMAPEGLQGLAWSEIELKRPEAALNAFSRLIEAYPAHETVPAARVQLARVAIGLKRYEEAIAALRPFPQAHPSHPLVPDARYLLGYARVAAGRDEGVPDLRAFVAAYPTHELVPQARRLIVDSLARAGRRGELAEEYKTLMAQSPPRAETLFDAGTIAALLGRSREAEAAWKGLRSEFPDHPLAQRAALELAQEAFDRSGYREAAGLARSASASTDPATKARAFLLLGESELKQKRWGPAHEAFREAVETAEGDDGIRYRALAGSGLALEEQDRWVEAGKYYQQVAEGSPDQDLRAWARSRRAEVASRASGAKSAPTQKPAPTIKPPAKRAPQERNR
jgi:TolA-binding protein